MTLYSIFYKLPGSAGWLLGDSYTNSAEAERNAKKSLYTEAKVVCHSLSRVEDWSYFSGGKKGVP